MTRFDRYNRAALTLALSAVLCIAFASGIAFAFARWQSVKQQLATKQTDVTRLSSQLERISAELGQEKENGRKAQRSAQALDVKIQEAQRVAAQAERRACVAEKRHIEAQKYGDEALLAKTEVEERLRASVAEQYRKCRETEPRMAQWNIERDALLKRLALVESESREALRALQEGQSRERALREECERIKRESPQARTWSLAAFHTSGQSGEYAVRTDKAVREWTGRNWQPARSGSIWIDWPDGTRQTWTGTAWVLGEAKAPASR